MKYDVFISYSKTDHDEVSAVLDAVRTRVPELTYWFDTNADEVGEMEEEENISRIDASSCLLFAISEKSLGSQVVKDQVMYAKNTGKNVIPLLLKGGQLKGWFLYKFGIVDSFDSTDPMLADNLVRSFALGAEGSKVKESPVVPPPPPVPNPAEKTWKVGDYYDVDGKCGVVFMVDMTGKRGKIISLEQVLLQWCVEEQMPQAVDAAVSDEADGAANLRAVMELDGWKDNYPAFSWCAERGNEWYLPAIDELKELMTRKDVREKVNATLKRKGLLPLFSLGHLKKFYWSSTSCNQQKAYILRADFLYPSDERKDSFCYVRAVSVF